MLQKSAPVKPAIRVRSLAEADPTYAATKELVSKLKTSSAKLDAEENELMHRPPPARLPPKRPDALLPCWAT